MKNIKERLIRLSVDIDNAGFSEEASELDSVINYSDDLAGENLLTDPGEVELVKLILDFLLQLKESGFTDEEVKEEFDKIFEPVDSQEGLGESLGDSDAST